MGKLLVAVALAVTGAVAVLIVGACGSGEAPPDGGAAQTGQAGASEAAGVSDPPARIVALTARGDVVVIDRVSPAREAKLTSFPWKRDAETGIIYGRADDLTALGGERILVSTCCEPAAGVVYLLEAGERIGEVNGWDPQVDAAGTRVAIAGILGIALHEAPLAPRPFRTLEAAPDVSGYMPEDPSWSPDGRELAFTSDGRLGRVSATAESLAEAEILEPADGTYWSSPAYTSDGIVAVEQSGVWTARDQSGSSRLVAVDFSTGEAVKLASSPGPITDVSVDASGRYLLWVENGRLRWRIDGATSTLEGDFVAAAWLPDQASMTEEATSAPAWVAEEEMRAWKERHDADGLWIVGFFFRRDWECDDTGGEDLIRRFRLLSEGGRGLSQDTLFGKAVAALEGAHPAALSNPLEAVRLELLGARVEGDTVYLDFGRGIYATNSMGTCGGSAMAVQFVALVEHYFPEAGEVCVLVEGIPSGQEGEALVFHDSVACPIPLDN